MNTSANAPHDEAALFDERLQRWRDWTATPWGRLRFAVVAQTLAWQVEALGGGPLRVLDVGGGDGRDSLPLARLGHHVTIVDPSAGMLEEARVRAEELEVGDGLRLVEGSLEELAALVGGDFDLVLCHFVLQYRPAGLEDLRHLAATLRPGGRLSVIAPNPVGAVLARVVREGPAAALEELDRPMGRTETFEHDVRKIDYEQMRADYAAVGLDVVAQYGGRCVNDLILDNEVKHDPDFHAALQRLELALCAREPYVRTGQFWQLVGARPPA